MVDNQGITSYITTIWGRWGLPQKNGLGCYRWLGWMMMYNLAAPRFACKRCLETRNTCPNGSEQWWFYQDRIRKTPPTQQRKESSFLMGRPKKPWKIHGWNLKKLTKLRRKIIFSIHLVSLDWKSTNPSVYLADPFPSLSPQMPPKRREHRDVFYDNHETIGGQTRHDDESRKNWLRIHSFFDSMKIYLEDGDPT